MLKKKLIKSLSPYLITFIGLFFAGLISFLLTSHLQSSKIESVENKVQGVTSTVFITNPRPYQSPASVETKPVIKAQVSITPKPTQYTPSATPSQSSAQTGTFQGINNSNTSQAVDPTPTANPITQTYQVNVSIKGSSNFSLSVSEGANQCDVLSRALAEGKISSLSMRYDSNYGSYAVYQINGIGKENSVWWVYEVNGQSPAGCSFVKAKNGDNIEWRYIGS